MGAGERRKGCCRDEERVLEREGRGAGEKEGAQEREGRVVVEVRKRCCRETEGMQEKGEGGAGERRV